MLPERLHKCRKPDCTRLISVGCNYCCEPCAAANEMGAEIAESGFLAHTETCDQRHRERDIGPQI